MAHGDARVGQWRGNWRMEWVASTLTPPPNVVYPAFLKLMRTPRLPAVDWTDPTTDLNGLVRFGERRNLVSARVPSRSARAIHSYIELQDAYSFFVLLLIYMLPECITNLAEVGQTTKKVEQARSVASVASILSMVFMALCDWAPQPPSLTLPAIRLECSVP